MKESTLLTISCLFLSSLSFGQVPGSLDLSGFKKLTDENNVVTYSFQNKLQFMISKNRFKTAAEARAFCSSFPQKNSLAKVEEALLIAMSGATNADTFLKNAITFDFKQMRRAGSAGPSGIVAWTSEPQKNGDIFMMYDGKGTESEVLRLEMINSVLREANIPALNLPAICVRSTK